LDCPTNTRRVRACLRFGALLRDQPLAPAARTLLRELLAAGDLAGLDRRTLVEQAALVLSELVDHRQLSDEAADRLWLALAGCAQSQHSLSRSAAEACIA
jgi:hypothetical protein